MKAIRFAAPVPTYLLTLAAGRLAWPLYLGPHACTRLADLPEPALPGPHWVRVRTRLGGICGSDLAIVTLTASPSTSPLSSFPFVPGHEAVGEIVEAGTGVRGFGVGERVAVNPLLSCEPRGLEPPCPQCSAGQPQRCARFTDGSLPAGMLIGTTRSLGGSWGEFFVAHECQLVRVPEALEDEEAVLIEPLACAVHAVRANPPAAGERVLVLGAGTIGLLTVAALHALAPRAETIVVARHEVQREQALRLGAGRVLLARGDLTSALADAAGARLLQPLAGPPIAVGGFERTFVCVNGRRGVEDALRFTGAGGTLVLLGNVASLGGLDWTPLWAKELSLRGSLCYGGAPHGGAGAGDFEEALGLVASRRINVRPLLTQAYPLAQYRRALATALHKTSEASLKVAFRF